MYFRFLLFFPSQIFAYVSPIYMAFFSLFFSPSFCSVAALFLVPAFWSAVTMRHFRHSVTEVLPYASVSLYSSVSSRRFRLPLSHMYLQSLQCYAFNPFFSLSSTMPAVLSTRTNVVLDTRDCRKCRKATLATPTYWDFARRMCRLCSLANPALTITVPAATQRCALCRDPYPPAVYSAGPDCPAHTRCRRCRKSEKCTKCLKIKKHSQFKKRNSVVDGSIPLTLNKTCSSCRGQAAQLRLNKRAAALALGTSACVCVNQLTICAIPFLPPI